MKKKKLIMYECMNVYECELSVPEFVMRLNQFLKTMINDECFLMVRYPPPHALIRCAATQSISA